MYYSQNAKIAIYAQNGLGQVQTKTAEGMLRYGKNPIVAVIDKNNAGKLVKDVIKIDSQVPIVGSFEESLKFKPDALLLGGAWSGGQLPNEWRLDIIKALKAKMDIINGLHDLLVNDQEIAQIAKANDCQLLDVREPPNIFKVASAKVLELPSHVVLTVGSDCSVGKMTAAVEITNAANKQGYKSKFIATGQTGIMIEGEGIAIDRVISDFAAGAVEHLIEEASEFPFIFVEGQGSLIHPGFSGVTLSILHGACPNSMILCHTAHKDKIRNSNFSIPSLPKLIELYESMAAFMRKAKVVGIALNTYGLPENEAINEIKKIELETGLTTDDPVRFTGEKLFKAVLRNKENQI